MQEDFFRLSDLFAVYGSLLTQRQQECLRMHLFEDYNLVEIGEKLQISRQAVYDMIHRTAGLLENYEASLAIFSEQKKMRSQLWDIYDRVASLRIKADKKEIEDILTRLESCIGSGRKAGEI